MTTQELKQHIDKVLGNNIRCLLPSYWWKRLFNQVADRIDDKQDILVSGKNIKTINGKDLLGEGDTNADIIINSVDELNALGLPAGSRASVVTGGPVLSSIRDCVESEIPTQWTRISGVKIDSFPVLPEGIDEIVILFTSYGSRVGESYILVSDTIMGAVDMSTHNIFTFSSNGKDINQSAVNRFNEYLQSGDYRLILHEGYIEEVGDFIDSFIKFYIYHPTISDVYVNADSWERLAKEYVVSNEEELKALDVEKGTIAKVASGSRIVGSFNSLAVGDRVTDVEFMQPPYAYGSCSVMFKDKDGNAIGFGVDSNGEECLFGLAASGIETILFGNENGIDQDLYNQAITIFKERECTFEWVEGKLPVDSFVRPVTNTPVVSDAYIKGETWTRLLKEGDVTGGGSEIREFYTGDSLTDEQKAWNLETATMVEENKCTTIFKVTAPLAILPVGTTIPLSAFVDRTFLYVFSSGVNAAFVSITIDSNGNSDITAETVSADATMSSTSTNAVQNKVVTAALNNKVDKVNGKQLSTEDFTSALKAKLEGLSNYDDTEIENAVSSLQTQLNTLVSGNASDAINSFNEIIAFLNGVKDSESLDSIIASIEQQIASKQDKISDLDTIRSGAAKGATALQEHQDISHLATKEAVTNLTNDVLDDEEIYAAAVNDLNIRVVNTDSVLSTEISNRESLQTEFQTFKTQVTENEEVWAASLTDVNNRLNTNYQHGEDTYAAKESLNTEIQTINTTILDNEEVIAATLTDLNNQIASLNALITDLTNRIETLENA